MNSIVQNLLGSKVLVTGGSRGIGAAIAMNLAERGAQLAITYVTNEQAAKAVVASLPGSGHVCFRMDLSDETSIQTGVDQLLEKWGALDGLVNNAGLTRDNLMLRMKTEDFDQVINANLRGSFLVTRACLKSFVKARKGSIINIASVIGQTGNAGQTNYSAAKAGMIGFTKALAQEIASRSVRVNCIAPGFIQTDMTASLPEEQKKAIIEQIPLGRIALPSEVASVVAFLLSSDSSYVTGHTLSVNGGMYMN